MKKILKVTVVVILIVILLICGVVGAAYESPLSIFLPAEESASIQDETGYGLVVKELIKYYADLEDSVNLMAKGVEEVEVKNSLSRDNIADVAVVYVIVSAWDDFQNINPCDFSSKKQGAENKKKLKEVFDQMNSYEKTVVQKQIANGGVIGKYSISHNDDSIYLNPDDEYGECLVSPELASIIPIGTLISIDGVIHTVAGTTDGVDENAISVCTSSTEASAYVGQLKSVSFVATESMPALAYTKTDISYVQLNIQEYINTFGFNEEQMVYYTEIAADMDELQCDAEDAYDITNENWSGVDLADVEVIDPDESQQEFIESIGNAAVKYYDTYKILPSLAIAQAINESGWGTSGLAKYHNYFGMKYRDGCGTGYVEKETQEQLADGSYITITAKFRAYKTREEGVLGYYQFLQYPRYSNLCGVTDYKVATTLIKEDGWATSHSYTVNLQRLIIQYSLTDYDKKAGAIP